MQQAGLFLETLHVSMRGQFFSDVTLSGVDLGNCLIGTGWGAMFTCAWISVDNGSLGCVDGGEERTPVRFPMRAKGEIPDNKRLPTIIATSLRVS